MTILRLNTHVFAALSDTQVVLLDRKSGAYEMIGAAEASPLSHLLPGWPVPDKNSVPPAIPLDHPCIQFMLEKNWITTDPAAGKDATPVYVEPAQDSLYYVPIALDEERIQDPIRLRHFAAFMFAFIRTKISRKYYSAEHAMMVVQRRRERKERTRRPLNREKAQQLVWIYQRLRSRIFTANNECLHDSLTFLHFIAWFGIYPQWIFGVQGAPFAAHCWVQDGSLLFNDEVEVVRPYVPIMAV